MAEARQGLSPCGGLACAQPVPAVTSAGQVGTAQQPQGGAGQGQRTTPWAPPRLPCSCRSFCLTRTCCPHSHGAKSPETLPQPAPASGNSAPRAASALTVPRLLGSKHNLHHGDIPLYDTPRLSLLWFLFCTLPGQQPHQQLGEQHSPTSTLSISLPGQPFQLLKNSPSWNSSITWDDCCPRFSKAAARSSCQGNSHHAVPFKTHSSLASTVRLQSCSCLQ